MKYFAVYLPMKDEEKSKHYRPMHLEYLAKKDKEGKIFARGRFTDGSAGLVIYIAENLEEAEAMAKEDPYIIHGARDYEIKEWDLITRAVLPE